MGSGAVAVFVGARLATRSNDTHFPFRQDSDFWYLTGFDHPDAVAVLRTDGGPPFTLFVQPRDETAEIWNGYRPGVEGARESYGADEAHSIDDLLEQIPKIIERADRIYWVLGRDTRLDQKLVEGRESQRQRSKQGVVPASELLDPRSIVHEMRLVKEDAELAIMRRGAEITGEGHAAAAALAHEGTWEYELEAELASIFRRRGGSGPAYTTIVGGGANATILHYVSNDQLLREGQLVLVDAGVELEGYASDVTRTYPVGGRFEGAGKEIYEVVLAAQEAALEACRPGTTLPAIHDRTLHVLTEGLVSVGLLDGDPEELVAKEAYRPFYMHGTSHWLGLDVHDCGLYARGTDHRKLEPGMVFTVEPGLYVSARSGDDVPEVFRGIGVRIEDNVVITQDGCENLTAHIPKRLGEIEAWVRGC